MVQKLWPLCYGTLSPFCCSNSTEHCDKRKEPNDKSGSIAKIMSLFLALTLLLRLVADVMGDPYLKEAVFGHADAMWDFHNKVSYFSRLFVSTFLFNSTSS